jgi:hypothetical protein
VNVCAGDHYGSGRSNITTNNRAKGSIMMNGRNHVAFQESFRNISIESTSNTGLVSRSGIESGFPLKPYFEATLPHSKVTSAMIHDCSSIGNKSFTAYSSFCAF